MKSRHRFAPVLLLVVGLLGAGCGPQESIRRYEVTKPPAPHRLLGALVRYADQFWFFKLIGPNQTVADKADAFDEFVKTLRFSEDLESPLEWTLPDGWEQQEGDQFRFATISIEAAEEPLDLGVSKLPFQGTDETAYVLLNINRWRNQLGVGPLGPDQLADSSKRISLAGDGGLRATVVNMTGEIEQDPMRSASSPHGQTTKPPPPSEQELKYTAPEGWQPGELVVARGGIQIRRAAVFEIKQDEQRVEITVTKLPERAADLTENVNRWRGQVQLEAMPADELAKITKQIPVGDVSGEYVALLGPEQAILGVIAKRQGLAWFVKLQGDRNLAARQQKNFEAFVQSLQF